MSKFLVFVDGFRARSQRDHRKSEELHRLAERLRPFADGDPTVADAFDRATAFDRAQTESARKVVTMPSAG